MLSDKAEAETHAAAAVGAPDRDIRVELVDSAGRTTGTAEKLEAHRDGLRHRAFSVFLLDEADRLVLQRRADGKYHSPGVWSNSCCGHPFPGESPEAAAHRRTLEELGVLPSDMRFAGVATYVRSNPISGLVENEYNHVFVGRTSSLALAPNPDEVSETSL